MSGYRRYTPYRANSRYYAGNMLALPRGIATNVRAGYGGYSSSYPRPSSTYRRYKRRYTGLPRTVSTNYPRPEQKFFDGFTAALSIPAAGLVTALFTPNQGSGANQVLGTMCNIKSVYNRFTVVPGTGNVPAAFRIIIGYDRQSNAALPLVSDIISIANVSSFTNLINRDRFVVLSNQYGTVNPAGQAEVFMEAYPKVNMQATINGTPGAIPTTGSIFILVISDQATAGNQPVYNATTRIKFVDV